MSTATKTRPIPPYAGENTSAGANQPILRAMDAQRMFGDGNYGEPTNVYHRGYMTVYFSKSTMSIVEVIFQALEKTAPPGKEITGVKTPTERVLNGFKEKYGEVMATLHLATKSFDQSVRPDMWNAAYAAYRKSLDAEVFGLLKNLDHDEACKNLVYCMIRYTVGFHLGDTEGD